MARKQFTEEQIIATLRQAEVGIPVGEVCRGMGLSKRREMRRLRDESHKLKTLVVDLTLDEHILQEALGKVVVRGTEFDPTPFSRQGWIGWADRTLTSDSGIP